MRKHTPGPWTAHARTVTAPETEDRLGLHVQINGGNREDNKANARLIAAAPDLLAALQASIELADRNRDAAELLGRKITRPPEMQAVYDACVAAVDKATKAMP